MRRATGRACLSVFVVIAMTITGLVQSAATASTTGRVDAPRPARSAMPRAEAASTTPTFSVIPITGPSACIRRVTAINADGDVVGTANFPVDISGNTVWEPDAFEWSLAGGVKRLPFSSDTPDNASGSAAEGEECSNLNYELTQLPSAAAFGPGGEVLGGTPHWAPPSYEPSSNSPAAWASTGATPTVLPNLCGQQTEATGAVFASNAAGDLVGDSLYSSSCQSIPLQDSTSPYPYYTPVGGSSTAIPMAPGAGLIEWPTAINDADQVVLGYDDATTKDLELGIWSPGSASVVPLGMHFPENQQFDAGDLSDSGVVVGEIGAQAVYSVNKPDEKSAGSLVTLPTLSGYLESAAVGVNNAGDVVGVSAAGTKKGGAVAVATAWPGAAPPSLGKGEAEPEPVDLNTLIPQTPGLTLIAAVLVNDEDDIVAIAETSSGSEEWVELVPLCSNGDSDSLGVHSISSSGRGTNDVCLSIKVTTESGSTSLSMHSGVSWLGPHKGIAFTEDVASSLPTHPWGDIYFRQKCLSACVNLVATVYVGPWGSGEPLGGDDVTAAVIGARDPHPLPKDREGHVCIATTFESEQPKAFPCGDTVTTTSESASTGAGQIPLRYWGPSVASATGGPAAYIRITAQSLHRCDAYGNCFDYGSVSKTVSVKLLPSLVYDSGTITLTPSETGVLAAWGKSGDIASNLKSLKSFVDDLKKRKVLTRFLPGDDLETFLSDASGYAGSVASFIMMEWGDNILNVLEDGLVFEDLHKIVSQITDYLLDYVKSSSVKKALNWIKDEVLGPSGNYGEQLATHLQELGDAVSAGHYGSIQIQIDERSECWADVNCLSGALGSYSPGSAYYLNVWLTVDGITKQFLVTTGYAAPTWLPEQCSAAPYGDACKAG